MQIGNIITLDELANEKFIISKIVSEGAFGIVYFLNSARFTFEPLAMKVFKEKNDFDGNQREALLWSRVGYHKNIAEFICCGKYKENFYILSRKYNKTLANINQEISNAFIQHIFSGLINGLYFANNKLGLIHKDIKPQNIFIDDMNNVKIGDFGLSSYVNKKYILSDDFSSVQSINVLSEKKFGGTIPFMYPYLFMGNKNFDITTDIYAVGITLFTIITKGLFPYIIPGFKQNDTAFNIFHNSRIDNKVKNCVLKCISIDEKYKYHTYDEIINEIDINIQNDKGENIEASINYIQTLRRTGQVFRAEYLLSDLLNEYGNNPLLINQKAIIEYNKGNTIEYLRILETFINSNDLVEDIYFIEPLFNLAIYYFQNDFMKMKPLLDKYKYLLNDDVIIYQYPEYSIYMALQKDYNKAFVLLNDYLENHQTIDKIIIFYFILCIRLNKITDLMKLLDRYNSELTNNLKTFIINKETAFLAADKLSNEMFGGMI